MNPLGKENSGSGTRHTKVVIRKRPASRPGQLPLPQAISKHFGGFRKFAHGSIRSIQTRGSDTTALTSSAEVVNGNDCDLTLAERLRDPRDPQHPVVIDSCSVVGCLLEVITVSARGNIGDDI